MGGVKVSKAVCSDEIIVKNNTSSEASNSTSNSTSNSAIKLAPDSAFKNLNSDKKRVEIDEAKLVATAQLDLAFSAIRTATLRKLPLDPDAYRFLMEACGRCGSSQRASELLGMMRSYGLILDSEIYSNYVNAFSVSNEISPNETIDSPIGGVSETVLRDVFQGTSGTSRKKIGSSLFKKKRSEKHPNPSLHSTDLSSTYASSQESWS